MTGRQVSADIVVDVSLIQAVEAVPVVVVVVVVAVVVVVLDDRARLCLVEDPARPGSDDIIRG